MELAMPGPGRSQDELSAWLPAHSCPGSWGSRKEKQVATIPHPSQLTATPQNTDWVPENTDWAGPTLPAAKLEENHRVRLERDPKEPCSEEVGALGGRTRPTILSASF